MDGTPFGRYRLVELLGRGGMGEVWRAYDTAIDRVVALKVLPANFADDPVFQERFRREAKAAAGLDEPHVVPIYDFGEIDGRLYVTMRLIKGRDLQTVLADGPLGPQRAVRIIEQVAKALHAAHRIGLIHRDIKPSNILIAEDDFAYLIDFGIARAAGETGITSTGAAIGTWAYMSPERLNTGRADARADIYALACVLHESLTGQRPYPGDSLEQQIVGHLTSPPPRPSMLQPGVPQPLDAVIAKGMAKQPDQRYASTVELARAARVATTVPLPRPGPTVPVHPPTQPVHRTAGRFHGQDTRLAAASAAPGLPPSGALVRPATVNVGFGLWLAASILIVIGGLVVALLSIDPAASDSEYIAGLVMTVGLGLFAVVLIFLILMLRGHRWARNLLTAGGTISVIVVVATLFISRSNASAIMSNASAVWSSGIVGSVLILGGIVLLHLKVAQAYFRHRKEVEAYFNRVAKNNRMPLRPPANHV